MSHAFGERLRDIELALKGQDERLEFVKETLAGLPAHLGIQLEQDWRDAFEEAVEVKTVAPLPPRLVCGIRA